MHLEQSLNKKMVKKAKNHKGFSMLESVIGIFIASSVFVVFLGLLPGVIKTESHAQRVLIATNLAQEGIEMVRNLRDNNLKNNCTAFQASPSPCFFPSSPYNNPSSSSFPNSYLPNSGSEYSYLKNFFREITISGTTEKTVTVTVKYGSQPMVTIATTLYPWGDKK